MKTVTILVQITVDEDNIINLYPNYRFNWNTPEQFIEHLTNNIETNNEIDGIPQDTLKTYGYDIRVLSREEGKVMEDNIRRCHLCNEPTVNKYCENKDCEVYQRDGFANN